MVDVEIRALQANDLVVNIKVNNTNGTFSQLVGQFVFVQIPAVGALRILFLLRVPEEALEHASEGRVFPCLLLLELFVAPLSQTATFFFLSSQSCLKYNLKLVLLRRLHVHESFDIVFVPLLNVHLFKGLRPQSISIFNFLLHVSSMSLLHHPGVIS